MFCDVGLVHNHDHCRLSLGEPLGNQTVSRSDLLGRIENKQHGVRLFKRAVYKPVQPSAESGSRPVQARRIDETMANEANRAVESIADMVAGLIEIDGLNTEERRVLANGVVGIAEGAGRAWIRRTNGLSAERLAELVAELAWAGLRGE